MPTINDVPNEVLSRILAMAIESSRYCADSSEEDGGEVMRPEEPVHIYTALSGEQRYSVRPLFLTCQRFHDIAMLALFNRANFAIGTPVSWNEFNSAIGDRIKYVRNVTLRPDLNYWTFNIAFVGVDSWIPSKSLDELNGDERVGRCVEPMLDLPENLKSLSLQLESGMLSTLVTPDYTHPLFRRALERWQVVQTLKIDAGVSYLPLGLFSWDRPGPRWIRLRKLSLRGPLSRNVTSDMLAKVLSYGQMPNLKTLVLDGLMCLSKETQTVFSPEVLLAISSLEEFQWNEAPESLLGEYKHRCHPPMKAHLAAFRDQHSHTLKRLKIEYGELSEREMTITKKDLESFIEKMPKLEIIRIEAKIGPISINVPADVPKDERYFA